MHADLDLLCISVYCTADDLLPQRERERAAPAYRRRGRDPLRRPGVDGHSERPSLPAGGAAAARPSLPALPSPGRAPQAAGPAGGDDRVADRCVRRARVRAADDVSCCSTRPRSSAAARSRPRAARELADVCGYGYSRSHSRWFWGMRLHLACAPDGTPRAAALVAADRPDAKSRSPAAARAQRRRDDRLRQGLRRPRVRRRGRALGGAIFRPPRADEPRPGPHLAPIRQRIESVFWTCKDLLTLERHGARTPRNLVVRVALRLLALAACISLNHQLGRPSRAIADYTA